jgi:hypothetical protein
VLVKQRGESDRDNVVLRIEGQTLGQRRAPRRGVGNGVVERIEPKGCPPA